MLSSIEGTHGGRCVTVEGSKNVHDVEAGPSPPLYRVRREGKRRGFSYFFRLLHTRPMILFSGAGRPVSGMYFVQAQCGIWQCPRRRDCFHW